MNNALWIPERAVELQLRSCVEAHCRSTGHRAYEATLAAIKEYVAWTTMAKDVKVFVQNCSHCVATIPEGKCPTPAGHAETCDQGQQYPAFLVPVRWVAKR
jgi:Integrase zinc binding domain